jgi:L-aminopeptidase/D-esterase-like protein
LGGLTGITAVPGIRAGHWTDREAVTGCTVVLCERGATGGVDVRGAAPGTRETDLMRPVNLVEKVHAIILTGGSAFGLDSAGGVMRFLEARGKGFPVRNWRVPIVGAAVLLDLNIGNGAVRPGAEEGYRACQEASTDPLDEGSVGAGTGATVAKALGQAGAWKGGLGTWCETLSDGTAVGAVAAVNAFGEIVDHETGQVVAGPRSAEGAYYPTIEHLRRGRVRPPAPGTNTTIGVVATNARLTKEQTNKLAQMAQDGLAMAIRPAHGMGDGDVVFALATGQRAPKTRPDVTALGALAAHAMARAIVRGVRQAESLGGVPSVRRAA